MNNTNKKQKEKQDKYNTIFEQYTDFVLKANIAEYSVVKGCSIIKPFGYKIWENIMNYFNKVLKEKEVENAYFPLFIPESFFHRESKHFKGFVPEVAWISNKDSDEKLALRPTSETIIYDSFSRWIRSWRDLPLKINQWCNIVRWETKAVKLFLRSREFLWQEGHCAFETPEQARQNAIEMLNAYEQMLNELLCIPVFKGRKTPSERFPGAKETYTVEGIMPDLKAIQLGTSHDLGQGFAKAFNITYRSKQETTEFVNQTSWGVSTRLIGGVLMQHMDSRGFRLPFNLSPIQIIIIPIFNQETKQEIIKYAKEIKDKIKTEFNYEIKIDSREEIRPGNKFFEYELKGIPFRIELGIKELKNNEVIIFRRDLNKKEKIKLDDLINYFREEPMHYNQNLFNDAYNLIKENLVITQDYNEFKDAINNKKIVIAPFCLEEECEKKIKEETNATTRCIVSEVESQSKLLKMLIKDLNLDLNNKNKKCIACDKPAKALVLFAKSY